jgi:hypothetical protein
MKIKNGIGAKNPTDILNLSAIRPITGGNTAPPTIDITINDEAFFVLGPRSFIPRAKIVGNITDMKKKTP